MEGDGDGQSGEDEIRCVVEGVADALAIAECALYQKLEGPQRALPDDKHDEAGDEKRQDHIDQRQDQYSTQPGSRA